MIKYNFTDNEKNTINNTISILNKLIDDIEKNNAIDFYIDKIHWYGTDEIDSCIKMLKCITNIKFIGNEF